MNFFLSINRNFFNHYNYSWIDYFVKYDTLNVISGCELEFDIANDTSKKYIIDLIEKYNYPNWKIQFHGPDLIQFSNNYLDILTVYHQISQKLGYCANVVFHPIASPISIKDSIEQTKKEFYKLIDLVLQYNLCINVSIENLNKMSDSLNRCRLEHLKDTLDIDNLYFTWDIGHQVIDNECTYFLEKKYKNKLNNVHIHDIEKSDHFPFYYNKIDLIKAFDYLININYSGSIVCEIGLDYLKSSTFEEKIKEYIENIYLLNKKYLLCLKNSSINSNKL